MHWQIMGLWENTMNIPNMSEFFEKRQILRFWLIFWQGASKYKILECILDANW